MCLQTGSTNDKVKMFNTLPDANLKMKQSTEFNSFVIEHQSPGFDFEPELERSHKRTLKELLKHTFYLVHADFFH